MTPERRQFLYSKMFHFMISQNINAVPFCAFSLCRKLGIEVVPLSAIVRDTGLSEDAVFSIWGNEDGVINCWGTQHKIAYNDHAPEGRIRFTLGEELSHMVFEHTKDPSFNMFHQSYHPDLYEQYEEEARIGSGLLLCHPKFFYNYQEQLTPNHLACVCGITERCAEVRYEILTRFKDEITSNGTYPLLPAPIPVSI